MTSDTLELSILLIDDHALLRAGLRLMLAGALQNVAIREAGSIAQATHETMPRPDLVLLDIELPELDGIEGLAVLRSCWPQARVVVLTSHTEVEVRESALLHGADGFLSKAEPVDSMVSTILAALRGDSGEAFEFAFPASMRLTRRQREVLDLLCRGWSNKVIAQCLALSENTVRGHMQALLGTLGVASRAEAVIVARERGLVHH